MAQATPRLLNRQKLLLSLLDALGGECGNRDFQKLLFLMCEEQEVPAYEFVPYQYGAFSFTCYADRRKLIERGWLADLEREWKLAPEVDAEAYCAEEVAGFLAEVGALRGDELVASTHRRFPYFASRRKIAKQVLGEDAEALGRIAKSTPPRGAGGLFTIGYEGRSLEAYLNLLLRSGITVLCDVRRNPLSRKYGAGRGARTTAAALGWCESERAFAGDFQAGEDHRLSDRAGYGSRLGRSTRAKNAGRPKPVPSSRGARGGALVLWGLWWARARLASGRLGRQVLYSRSDAASFMPNVARYADFTAMCGALGVGLKTDKWSLFGGRSARARGRSLSF